MLLSFYFLIFRAPVGGKKGVAAMPGHKGLVPQNPTKNLAHVGVVLGHLLSQYRVPKLSDPGKSNHTVHAENNRSGDLVLSPELGLG